MRTTGWNPPAWLGSQLVAAFSRRTAPGSGSAGVDVSLRRGERSTAAGRSQVLGQVQAVLAQQPVVGVRAEPLALPGHPFGRRRVPGDAVDGAGEVQLP